VPKTEPAGPCNDPYAGGPKPRIPGPDGKVPCRLGNQSCVLLTERFLLIQSGLNDDKEGLLLDIASMEEHCKVTEKGIQEEIQDAESIHAEAQTALGEGTQKEAEAGEKVRRTTAKNKQFDDDLRKQMKACSESYLASESEQCALKKIRGEIYKMNGGPLANATFTDCTVGPWKPEECTKACRESIHEPVGTQVLLRDIMQGHDDLGAGCLPLEEIRTCNPQACPVDCKLGEWQGWSKCSAECGGGVEQRLRLVDTMQAFDGEPCGKLSETRACNTEACEVDCGLTEWTKWSWCSKDCDGGTRKRQRFVTKQPKGQGECPDAWDPKRLEYTPCNEFECLSKSAGHCSTFDTDNKEYTCDTLPSCCEGHVGLSFITPEENDPHYPDNGFVQCYPASYATTGLAGQTVRKECPEQAMKCNKALDVVLLIDGSGSLGQEGWNAEITAAQSFVRSFNFGAESKAQMSVILYSGPRYWNPLLSCFHGVQAMDQEQDCKIVRVTKGFTNDMAAVKTAISNLVWPQGSTLTSLALLAAKTELSNGRGDAESVVVTITDGRPFSKGNTGRASRELRKNARLVWVPVTRNAPLKWIKRWATRRWQENVVNVEDFAHLTEPWVITQIVADICPTHDPLL